MLEKDKKIAKTINTHYDDEILASIQTLVNAHSEMDGKTFYKYFYPDFEGDDFRWRTYASGKYVDFKERLGYYIACLDPNRKLIFCAGLREYAVDRVKRFERLFKETDKNLYERLNRESEVAK